MIINGTGSHRANTRDELVRMLGAEVVDTVRVVNHDAFDDDTLAHLGRTSYGGEVWLNRDYLRADVRIATGFIEPHFFAGFSGGPKGVVPGLAGLKTIMRLHNAATIGHPRATWASAGGQPRARRRSREVGAMAPPDFWSTSRSTPAARSPRVFAGHLHRRARRGLRFVRAGAMRPVAAPFDVVVTTNSGYPLDQNLYQAVKGMSAAARIVRPGGAIVAPAECSDGLPDHGNYKDAAAHARHAGRAARADRVRPASRCTTSGRRRPRRHPAPGRRVPVLIARPAVVRAAMLEPVADLGATLAQLLRRYGPGARVAVLPEGPQTVPLLREVMA